MTDKETAQEIYDLVFELCRDYGDDERGIIAQIPFEATFSQVMFEKYGITEETGFAN